MLTVLAPDFTLSIWAAASGTSGKASPTLTFSLLSWAVPADTHRHRAAVRPAARNARRTMTQLLGRGRFNPRSAPPPTATRLVSNRERRVSSSESRFPGPAAGNPKLARQPLTT